MKTGYGRFFGLMTALAFMFLPCIASAQSILGNGSSAYDFFGASVSGFANYAVVGAYGADTNGSDSGLAYIYQYSGAGWDLMAQLPNGTDEFAVDSTIQSYFSKDDRFGRSVAIYGNVAVVGAPFDDPEGVDNAGSAYVFERDGSVWHLRARLTASDKQINSEFGKTAAIEGNWILVGAPSKDAGSSELANSGAVYVFEMPNDGWADMVETQKVTAPDAQEYASFGASLSISGDLAVIGAPDANTFTGEAYIYKRDANGNWSRTKTLYGEAVNDRFGTSVAVSGSWATVGAPLYDSAAKGDNAGAVYVYTNTSGSWVQSTLLESPDIEKGFGFSASLQNEVAVFGSYDSFNETDFGHFGNAHIYSVGDWAYTGTYVGEGTGEGYGYSVDVSDYFILAGDREADLRQGAVFVQPASDAANQPPIVYGLADFAIGIADGSFQETSFSVYDMETAADTLTLELTCPPFADACGVGPGADPLECDIDLDGDCAADIGLAVSGAGEARTLGIATIGDNTANADATADIALSVSDGQATDTANFTLSFDSRPTVSFAGADPPPVIEERTIENPSSLEIGFNAADDGTDYGALILEASSSNSTLVSNSDSSLIIDRSNQLLTVIPALDQYGVTTITLSATDSIGNVGEASFELIVNSLPTIGDFQETEPVPVNEETSPVTVTRTFFISDKEPTDVEPLTLNSVGPVSSTNASLVTDFGYSRTGEEVTVAVEIAPGESGTISIPVEVTDKDGGVGARTLQLPVEGTSPQILTDVTSVLMNEGEFSKVVAFEILDTDTPIDSIEKDAISDASWLPKGKLGISCGTSCTLTIYPPDSANYDQINGPATITLSADDGDPDTGSGTYDISFTFNLKPAVSPLSDMTVNEGDPLTFSFTATDTNLDTVTARATNVSNAELFTLIDVSPQIECQLDSASGAYKCNLNPLVSCTADGRCAFNPDNKQQPANESGIASIIVTAKDSEGLTASESFVLTVNDVNEPPAPTPETDSFTMKEDQSGAVGIDLSDPDGDQLTLTATSLNEDLIPNTSNNLKICEVPAGSTSQLDPTSPDPPSDWTCYSADAYSTRPDASGVYGSIHLFIHPAVDANEELFGTADIEVSVADSSETVAESINVNVTAQHEAPLLSTSTLAISMNDDRDAVTAEANAIAIEVGDPDGPTTLNFGVDLEAGTVFQQAYFLDSAGNATTSDTVQLGETLSLDLVLIPTPNTISEVTLEGVNITVSDGSFSSSETITAEIAPINDPPNIFGLESQYPCSGCLLDAEPPWLQDERKTIRFQVDDPDVQDSPDSLNVTAEWGLGVDPENEFTPQVVGDITTEGQVDLLVQPPNLVSGWLNLTVTVTDGRLTYSQDTVINVEGVNYPPEFVEPLETTLETNEDQSVSIELTITDTETVRLSKLTLLREWTSVDPVDMPKGSFSGGEITDQGLVTLNIHPPAEWPKRLDAPAHAEILLAVQEPDGTLSEPVVIDLFIQGVADAPQITSITALDPTPTIDEGGAFTLDFRVEDVDTPVDSIVVDAPTYDPGITDLTLTLSTPVCTNETANRKRCKMTAKAADQSSGEAVITLQVKDDTPAEFQGPLTDLLEAPLTVQAVDDPPSFKVTDPLPIVTEEDVQTTAAFEITDPDPDTVQEDLQVVESTLSWSWTDTETPDAPVNVVLSPGNIITITPTQNGFGRGVVSLDVTDGVNTVSTSFNVVVTAVNDAPTLTFTSSPGGPLDQDTPADFVFTVSDVETSASNLILNYKITWTEGGVSEELTPYTDYLLVTGTGQEKTVQFTPPDGRPIHNKAVAVITATVSDRDNENPLQDVEDTVVEYLPVDDPPVIVKKNGMSVETIEEDSGAFYVDFTVSDPETPAGDLITTTPVISGDNPAILPEGNFFFESISDATRRLNVTPAPDENGQVDITVSVLDAPAPDGLESMPLTFTLDVTPVPDPPTISFLKKEGSAAQETQIVLDEGQTTADLADTYIVEVKDPDTALSDLIVGAVWDTVPGRENDFVEGEIRLEGTAETRTVVITPDEYDHGYARITPWVKDSPGAAPVKAQPFELRVGPVNNPPILNVPIANPDDIIFVEGNVEYLLRFEVRDVDSSIRNLLVSAESGDSDLLPQTDETRFDWGLIEEFDSTPNLDNMTHGLLMKPLPLGGADPVDVPVKILASDQTDFTEFNFTLRVFPDVTPPRIRIAESVIVSEDPATPRVVDFWVWDEKKDPWEMEVFVSSGQTDYIPNSNITVEPIFQSASDPGYSENADNWRLTFKPALNAPFQDAEFTTQLNVSVNNGLFETVADPPLGVTIVNKNDAPEISEIPNQNVHLNETVTVNFTVDDVDEGPANVDVSATADPAVAQFEFTNGAATGEPAKPYVKDWTMKVIPTAISDSDTSFQVTVTATDTSGVVDPGAGEEGNTASTTFTINMGGVAPGDVDGSGTVDLGDAISALQAVAGIPPTSVFIGADINNDGQIGLAEAVNALTEAAAP